MTGAFIEQIRQATGFSPDPAKIVPGRLGRFSTSDRRGDENGWYRFFEDQEGGVFGCWRQGISETWQARQPASPEQRAAFQEKVRLARQEAAKLEEQQRAECREWCIKMLASAKDATSDNPYLKRKCCNAYAGVKALKDSLLVPVQDMDGIVHGIQFIQPDGSKRFKTGSVKAGNFFKIGTSKNKTVVICEGYATGSSVHQATGHAVVIAFDAGNLLPVAQGIRSKYPNLQIIVAADDDHSTDGNPGLTKATEAARAVGGLLARPVFPETRGAKDTDFNDLARLAGLAAVVNCIDAAATPEQSPVAETQPGTPRFDLSRLLTGADIAAGDYEVSFLVDRLIPENSITLFYAKGGSGKSTLATQIAAAVKTGAPFMGLATLQRPVVVLDYENPRAVLKKRVQAVEGAEHVHYWIGSDLPQLNTAGWVELKSLVMALCNPLVIVDTLSSSCSSLDIANNKDLAPVMSKIIELRNMGATIVLLHHTPKSDETKYIGASCIFNQCDHVLAMYPVRQAGSDQEATDDDEQKVYRLGTKDKSRFDHFHLYAEFDDCSGTFTKAPDPAQEFVDALIRFISDQPGITQTDILSKIGPKNKIRSLLKNNDGVVWRSEKGARNATHYYPISVCQFAAPLRAGKLENWIQLTDSAGKTETENSQQNTVNTEFSCFSVPAGQTGKLDELPDFDLEV